MSVSVREMLLEEVAVVIDYFHESSAEHLELLGVDPTRLPGRVQWRQLYESGFAQPIERRRSLLLLWELDAKPIRVLIGGQDRVWQRGIHASSHPRFRTAA